MEWASIISTALKVLNMVLAYIRDAEQRGIGRDQAIKEGLEAAQKGLQDAQAARAAVRHDATINPDRVRDDDGFKRPGKKS